MKREEWLRPYTKAYSGRIAAIAVLSLLTALSASLLLFTSGYLISKAALRPENVLMIYVPIVLVRTFGIGKAALHYIERLVSHDTVLRILSQMRVRLYQVLEPQALFVRSRFRTGELLGTLADDIEHLQNVYLRTVFPMLTAVIMYGLWIAALGCFNLSYALLMGGYVGILVFILPGLSLWLTRKKYLSMKKERQGLYQKLTDAVLGINDWVISGRAQQFVGSYENDERKVAAIDSELKSWGRWRFLIGQCVVGIAVVSMICWSEQLTVRGDIPAVWIAAFVLVVFPLMDVYLPASEAVEKIPEYQDSRARLAGLSDPSPVQAGEAAPRGLVPEPSIPEEALRQARQHADIRLDQVRFRYDGAADRVLDGISLHIPQGAKVAVLGRSGAGKSTLLKLIQGAITPESGRVTINRVSADRFGEHIPEVMAMLNQSPYLFDTSVANNIRLGRPDAAEDEVRHVSRLVGLDMLIESLPAGYATPMLEAGQRFSGGERQRIALARILLQNTPVVLLDEPTVGLDPKTEQSLLATIFDALQGKTLLWITHHLLGVHQMDKVIFLENGKITMSGPHAELMARNAHYRQLHHLDYPAG
ncbi:thiol reductant ABC exporter subunit CydC [Paenibacillus sp. 32O-W]|uniref:thiol reductant ABC exporter subunit CydC n=1 Tax=Paenibacillus sp. 32O-W TaxID=1695218 RepID=UPI0011A3B4C3|nr:thiol reductant ABC exporter subunit CydC [Paenibacillus sp. 32O-W]